MTENILCALQYGFEVLLVPFLYGTVTVSFVYGLLQWRIMGYDEHKLEGAKALFLWCSIALGVTMLVWTIGALTFHLLGVSSVSCRS